MHLLTSISLGIETICIGLFSGLMLTLISIIRPMLNSLSAAESTFVMQKFLKFAYKNPVISAITFISALFPILALCLFLIQAYVITLAFILTLIGWLLIITGVIIITQRINAPLYDKISHWNTEQIAPDWRQSREKWYTLNYIRGVSSGIAFLLFLLAFLLAR